jgi:uncharacterized protein with HEPN domain
MSRDAANLLDMVQSARDACRFVETLSLEEFRLSELHQHAVAKAVELVGEAASRVSAATSDAHPEIPWTRIVGMRHRLVHDYVNLDVDLLWEVVKQHLPPLIAQVDPLVPPEEI